MRFPDARILVFAKAPVAGTVKTRLQPQCSALRASNIHKELVRATLHTLSSAHLAPIELWCAPACQHPFFQLCRRHYAVRLRKQFGGDLGSRMVNAFRCYAQTRQPTILLGSDCGSLRATQVEQAIELLYENTDVVIAPAEDGGYTLLGACAVWPGLFRCMPWGGPHIAQMTRQRLQRHRISYAELPMQWDVDNYQDYRRWKNLGFER